MSGLLYILSALILHYSAPYHYFTLFDTFKEIIIFCVEEQPCWKLNCHRNHAFRCSPSFFFTIWIIKFVHSLEVWYQCNKIISIFISDDEKKLKNFWFFLIPSYLRGTFAGPFIYVYAIVSKKLCFRSQSQLIVTNFSKSTENKIWLNNAFYARVSKRNKSEAFRPRV